MAVFHRGPTRWTRDTFDVSDRYRGNPTRPITVDTVVLVRADTGQPLYDSEPVSGEAARSGHDWGAGMFFVPHGLTVDRSNGDYWLTDVALHQVRTCRRRVRLTSCGVFSECFIHYLYKSLIAGMYFINSTYYYKDM